MPPGGPGRPGGPGGYGGSRRPPPPRRGIGFFGILALVLLGVATLVGGGLAFLVLAPPVDTIRAQVIAQIKAKTGRDLVIGGPVSFAVYPALTLTLKDVTLSGPPGMGPEPFATAAGIEARVKLLPLLQRQIRIDQLILREPVFDLRVDAAGRRNFEFAAIPAGPADRDPVRYAQATVQPGPAGLPGGSKGRNLTDEAIKDFVDNASNPDNPSPQTRQRLKDLEDLTLGDVRIERGAVIYSDARNGVSEQFTAIDATVSLASLASPLETTGTATYAGQPVGFEVKLASPKALLEDRPARLKAAIKAAAVDARYDGALTARSGVELDGDLSAKGPSVRGLMRWLGTELPPADGFGPGAIEAKVRTSLRGVHLSDMTVSLDDTTATGTLAIDTSDAKPKLVANLKVGVLDLNRYTLAAATKTPEHSRTPALSKPVTSKPPVPKGFLAPAETIEDLLRNETAGGPKVKGYTQRDGWSSEPISLDALGALDADARLTVGQVRWREIKTGAGIVTVALKGRVLRVNLDDMQFYDGKGRGVVTIDANAKPPTVGANISADGVAGLPLLKDAVGFDLVSGTAKVAVAVGAQGSNELALVESLNGKADIQIANGAIKGYNIAGALRAVSGGQLQALNKAPTEKTDFSELSATFQIAKGVATNQDLRLLGPLVRLGGGGQISLPPRSIDYTLRPKLVGTIEGQGGNEKLAGLEIPVRITGPLSGPEIRPDVGSLLKDPDKAVDAVKEIGRQLKQGGVSNALKSLLGRRNDAEGAAPAGDAQAAGQAAGQPAPAATKPNAKQLLDGLLGRQPKP